MELIMKSNNKNLKTDLKLDFTPSESLQEAFFRAVLKVKAEHARKLAELEKVSKELDELKK